MTVKDELEVSAFALRWHKQLREQIVSAARQNHRTINGEIRARLERDLAREAAASGDGQGVAA